MGQYLEKADKALAAIKTAVDRPDIPNDINAINDKRLHGIPLADLREAAALAHAVSVRRMRERGEVPPSYTAVTDCAGCGPVPIFAGAPDRVLSCPWCMNRHAGRPVPKA